MSQDWKQWEGQVVNGKFPLLRYLGGSEYSAVFLTEFNQSERPQRAAIKLIPPAEKPMKFNSPDGAPPLRYLILI